MSLCSFVDIRVTPPPPCHVSSLWMLLRTFFKNLNRPENAELLYLSNETGPGSQIVVPAIFPWQKDCVHSQDFTDGTSMSLREISIYLNRCYIYLIEIVGCMLVFERKKTALN